MSCALGKILISSSDMERKETQLRKYGALRFAKHCSSWALFSDVSFVTVDGSVVNVNIGRTKDAPTSS